MGKSVITYIKNDKKSMRNEIDKVHPCIIVFNVFSRISPLVTYSKAIEKEILSIIDLLGRVPPTKQNGFAPSPPMSGKRLRP